MFLAASGAAIAIASTALFWWLLPTYIAVWNYPINVGGRPLNSWPSFVVPAEANVLIVPLFRTLETVEARSQLRDILAKETES